MMVNAENQGAQNPRPVQFSFELGHHADGNCVARLGKTTVLCTARIERRVPPHIRGSGKGWLTAEYAMLPNATHSRMSRLKSLEGGRSKEISRLIGRSLRAVCDLGFLGEKQITIDCDVLHADGGTRTAAINGSFIALYRALASIQRAKQVIHTNAVALSCAVTSNNQLHLDPDYLIDSSASADANFVFSGNGNIIELQASAEGYPIAHELLPKMLILAQQGCRMISTKQAEALGLDSHHFYQED